MLNDQTYMCFMDHCKIKLDFVVFCVEYDFCTWLQAMPKHSLEADWCITSQISS